MEEKMRGEVHDLCLRTFNQPLVADHQAVS
jgi:hypothetical protein